MVRCSLYRGGRRLIFASDKFCVCRQEFVLYCFTDMICVSIAVVGDKGRPLAGWPCDLWHFICRISFCPDDAAVAISSCDYNGCKWEYGRGFRSWGWVSSCHFLLFKVMALSQLLICHCLVKNPGGCWFGIFSMTVTYQFRAGSGFWTIIGCLVEPGWRSWWYTAVRSRSGAHSSRRSYTHEFSSQRSHAWVLHSICLYPVVGRHNTMTWNLPRLELTNRCCLFWPRAKGISSFFVML